MPSVQAAKARLRSLQVRRASHHRAGLIMTYAVKEIYYTLQGEGANAGRPAVFLRFSGCNLWNGLPEGREKGTGGCARWCDTDFVGTDGPNGGKFSTPAELANTVRRLWPVDAAAGD